MTIKKISCISFNLHGVSVGVENGMSAGVEKFVTVLGKKEYYLI